MPPILSVKLIHSSSVLNFYTMHKVKIYLKKFKILTLPYSPNVGLGGLGVTCLPRDPRFAVSNPAKVNGFFSGHKNPEHKSSGRDSKLGVPSLRF